MTNLTRNQLEEANLIIEELEKRKHYRKIDFYFPDSGEFSREKYNKHIEFFTAGAKYITRAFIAANQVGKSFCASYEVALHLTGQYPDWWPGYKFKHPIDAWAIGVSAQSTKDVIQEHLLGNDADIGSGMIPKDLIDFEFLRSKQGVSGAKQEIRVKHFTDNVHDGYSVIGLKDASQGREKFQGTHKHLIWFDEEPTVPGVYSECITRTIKYDTDARILATFTPLNSFSDVYMSFLPDGYIPENGIIDEDKFVIGCKWADNPPHLTEKAIARLKKDYAEHEMSARSEGIPGMGAGLIYPLSRNEIVVESFPIPAFWPRAFSMDSGYRKTAAVWITQNPMTGVIYVYHEYAGIKKTPADNAFGILSAGDWIPGVIDPSDYKAQKDGTVIAEQYRKLGLKKLYAAENPVEGGIQVTYQMLVSGKLKIFATCTDLLKEIGMYRRDLSGKVAKNQEDDKCDALRYAVMSGVHIMETNPDILDDKTPARKPNTKNSITGY